jgi:hypothetical protein
MQPRWPATPARCLCRHLQPTTSYLRALRHPRPCLPASRRHPDQAILAGRAKADGCVRACSGSTATASSYE